MSDYFRDLQQTATKLDCAKFAAMVAEFRSTLQQLPNLQQEMDALLVPDQLLDYTDLLQSVRPKLELAISWFAFPSSTGYDSAMGYEIISTDTFRAWFESLRDASTRRRILARVDRLATGNFGDHKALGDGLSELRLFFEAGYRIYYTQRGQQIILLLTGGDKSSQSRDIQNAREILDGLE